PRFQVASLPLTEACGRALATWKVSLKTSRTMTSCRFRSSVRLVTLMKYSNCSPTDTDSGIIFSTSTALVDSLPVGKAMATDLYPCGASERRETWAVVAVLGVWAGRWLSRRSTRLARVWCVDNGV